MKETCRLLNINKLQTTPYHPPTNGILERWHRDLKGMLRKQENQQEAWDRLLKYCLLSFRASPHSTAEFSPFELVHGRNLRGPLEAIKDGCLTREVTLHSTVEYVQQFRETLTRLHGKAAENEGEAKRKSREVYDRKKKEDVLQKGKWCWYIHRVFQGNWRVYGKDPLRW